MHDESDALVTRLAALFAADLNIAVPSPDTDLLETGRLDSVGIVELLLELEQQFGVHVELAEMELDQFRTLRTIAALVAAHRPAAVPERAAP